MAPKVAIVYVRVPMAIYSSIISLTVQTVLHVRPHPGLGRGREEGH